MSGQSGPNRAPTRHPTVRAHCAGPRRLRGSAQMRRVLGRRTRSPGQPSAAAVPAHAEPLTIFVDLAISPPVPAEPAQDPEHAVLLAKSPAGPRQGVVDDDVPRGTSSISLPMPSGCPSLGELSPRATGPAARAVGADAAWADPSSTIAAAVMLAAIEHLEGRARPCRRTRRLPEKNLPDPLRLSEDARWAASEPVRREMDRRLHGRSQLSRRALVA